MDDEAPDEQAESIFTRQRFQRSGTGLEFDRVANFADAIYAISLTLIVVGIVVPRIQRQDQQSRATGELDDAAAGHHHLLRRVPGRRQLLDRTPPLHELARGRRSTAHGPATRLPVARSPSCLFLLQCSAPLTANPLAFATVRTDMAAASLLETFMIGHAHRAGLMRQTLSEPAYRWERAASFSAVVIFLVSIPVALYLCGSDSRSGSPNAPVGSVLDRRRPDRSSAGRVTPRR